MITCDHAAQIADLQAQVVGLRDALEAIAEGLPALQSCADKAAIGAAVQVRAEMISLWAEMNAPGYGPGFEARARRSQFAVLAGGA
jgi:hypothetical protein